ncbi:MAG: penicillin-binding protein 1A [bacterium]|nr:penicillin-binding protein 1A [bacterium]
MYRKRKRRIDKDKRIKVFSPYKPRKEKGFKKGIIYAFLLCLTIGIGAGAGVILALLQELPSLSSLEEYTGKSWAIPTKIYSIDNQIIAKFGTEEREIIGLEDCPKDLINAIISIEDANFYKHKGISLKGILRAFWVNLKALRIKEGGSTITQQLSKILFLTRERTFSRKIQEMILALKIELGYTKDEILERYLNKIYFGHGIYGIEAASNFYFNKSTKELNLAECALLAGIPRAPNRYSPILHPESAIARQSDVLNRMYALGYINSLQKEEAKKAMQKAIKKIKGHKISINKAPYFVEYIRQRLEEKYGENAIYKGGLKVYTTLDLKMQHHAQQALKEGLERLNRGRKKKVEGAFIAISPKTGYIKAMVGGSGFRKENQLNRTVQAKRQPGSAFKPFLYAAAIEEGFTAASTIMDSPVVYKCQGGTWAPHNYSGGFYGRVRLRKALEKSINVASVKLMNKVTPKKVVDYARNMGIKSVLRPNLSLALGTSEVTPLELVVAYSTFANLGIRVEPIAIRYIEDREGNSLMKNVPKRCRVLSEETAYIITSLLQGVVKRGTAAKTVGARIPYPIAGKTGTSDNFVDAWFIGYTPDLCAGVWIGHDEGRISLGKGQVGGVVAAPIFTDFFLRSNIPFHNFRVPQNICYARVCEETGLLATPFCPKTINEVFIKGIEPVSYCIKHYKHSNTNYNTHTIDWDSISKPEEEEEDSFDKVDLEE